MNLTTQEGEGSSLCTGRERAAFCHHAEISFEHGLLLIRRTALCFVFHVIRKDQAVFWLPASCLCNLQMIAVWSLAEPWKIYLLVTQVLGKWADAAGSEMKLQLEAFPGYQSPIQGLFMEAFPTRSCVWFADCSSHIIDKSLCADAVLILCKYKTSRLITFDQKRTIAQTVTQRCGSARKEKTQVRMSPQPLDKCYL